MSAETRWMSFEMFRALLVTYPGPKWALSRMTEEDLAALKYVLDTRFRNGTKEYLLDLIWMTTDRSGTVFR